MGVAKAALESAVRYLAAVNGGGKTSHGAAQKSATSGIGN